MTDSSTRTRYGIANPERIDNPLWQSSIKGRWSGYRLHEFTGLSKDNIHWREFFLSSYREATPGPFWAWERMGRTSKPLLDGRIIHVAGEHEDFYDPNFCIYNDVVIEHPDGLVEILLYPKEIFPPTDFHSATLIGRSIFLIGSIGYKDLRKPGETQVLKLDTDTWQIERVETTGEIPGWIARHTAQQLSETTIGIAKGSVQTTPDDRHENSDVFTLDITTLTWRREPPGTTLSAKPWDDEELELLETVEIELLIADENYPITNSLKLLEFFERNESGSWTCIRPTAIAGPNGEGVLVRPRQTFSQAMTFAGIDIHEKLQGIAWRADRR